ncbi:MAG: hypothetical protein PHS41_11340, partial [Victivallaceae bacterium]|nr:hypothetical protein [Victivallaceae bacterium]
MNKISPGHPLSRAQWLWPLGNIYLTNCHAQFRYDFELTAIPEVAPLFLTADQSYRLYVNGRYVCRGPARGYQDHWPFDEVDLSSYLREGHNFLAVEAYNPGMSTFQYVYCNCAGFLAAAEWGDVQIHTDSSWLMRRAPGNRPHTAILSRQLAWQEDFNAAEDDGSWIVSAAAPVWKEDAVFHGFGIKPYGQDPYHSLECREIPMLRDVLMAPAGISACGTGMMAPGYESTDNISWHWVGKEAPGADFEKVPHDFAQKEGDMLSFTVEPAKTGGFRFVTLDLGEIRYGSLRLEAEHCNGGEIIDCHYHQYLADGTPKAENLIPVGEGGYLALASRIRARKGTTSHEFFGFCGA